MVLLESKELELGKNLPAFKGLKNANYLEQVAAGRANTDYESLPLTAKREISHLDLFLPIVTVAFICNHCPYVHEMITQFTELSREFESSVQTLAISSNDTNIRPEDGFNAMTKFAEKHSFGFPYLFDETQQVAKDFDANCTPDIFVYKLDEEDKAYKLVYHGASTELERIYNVLLKNDTDIGQMPASQGCSIKWKEC
jgi:peroxiredoxin